MRELAIGSPLVSTDENEILGLDTAFLTRHVTIIGATGSGKSTTAKIIAYEAAANGIPVVIFDRTGEFAEDLAQHATILEIGKNLTVAPFRRHENRPLEEEIEEWISLLDHFNQTSWNEPLTPLQSRSLRQAILQHYKQSHSTLTFAELIRLLEDLKDKNLAIHGWHESIEALISRIHQFTVGRFNKVFNQENEAIQVKDVFGKRLHLFNLAPLHDDRAKNLLSQIILKEIYEHAKTRARVHSPRLLIVIDECHHLAPSRPGYISIPEKIAIELRKYGVAQVTIATRPCLISENILANSGTLILHKMTDARDIEVAINFLNLTSDEHESYRRKIRTLRTGEALIQVHPSEHPEFYKPVTTTIGLPQHHYLITNAEEDELSSTIHRDPFLLAEQIPPWAKHTLVKIKANPKPRSRAELNLTRTQAQYLTTKQLITTNEEDKVTLTPLGEKLAEPLIM